MVVEVQGAPGDRAAAQAAHEDGDDDHDERREPTEATVFRDREDAGVRLGAALLPLRGPETIVVALPRGGVLVGHEVARALSAPLDIWVVRKIGVPGHEELGLGAVAEGGYTHLSPEIVASIGLSRGELARLIKRKRGELERRRQLLRGHEPHVPLGGKTVIVVDDGIATGGTIRAVAGALRREQPARLVLAVPVAAAETIISLAGEFDEVVCLEQPEVLHAVGLWYEDFGQVDDAEVMALLAAAQRERRARHESSADENEPDAHAKEGRDEQA